MTLNLRKVTGEMLTLRHSTECGKKDSLKLLALGVKYSSNFRSEQQRKDGKLNAKYPPLLNMQFVDVIKI
jgi:hypothetical protein